LIALASGSHRYRTNDLEGSERAYARAEAVARVAGAGLPLASAINGRALLLMELGRYEEASQKFSESSEIRRTLFGPNDADTLSARRDLARSLFELGDPAGAHEIAASVLAALPFAGPRASGLERSVRFIVLAATARRDAQPDHAEALRAMWAELMTLPRAHGRTDRQTERLRAQVGLEFMRAWLACIPRHAPGWDAALLAQLCDEIEADLAVVPTSPKQQLELDELRRLCAELARTLDGAAPGGTIQP
jgi:tetratricopeptide (TPR) repeat protein